MKKWNILLTTLLITVLTISCEEKIAQELKAVNTSATAAPTTVEAGAGFRVTNLMGSTYSHILHKEGSKSTGCELTAPVTGWKAGDYAKDDPTVAIDCVLEVEERDLHRNGAKIQFEADEGVCEYVDYTPMKFFKSQPGITTIKQYQVECDATCGDQQSGACGDLQGKTFLNYNGRTSFAAGAPITTDVFYNDTTNDPKTCRFDYSDINDSNGNPYPNCDQGKITTYQYKIESYVSEWCHDGNFNEIHNDALGANTIRPVSTCTLTGSWDDNGTCTDATITDKDTCLETSTWTENWQCTGFEGVRTSQAECELAGTVEQRRCGSGTGTTSIVHDVGAIQEEDCGGDIYNCMEGQGTKIGAGPAYTTEISHNSEDDSTYLKGEKEILNSFDLDLNSNMYAASYARTCVNADDKPDFENVSFSGADIEEINAYERNYGEYIDIDNNGITDYILLGSHPFKGVPSIGYIERNATKAYYSFECLDQARDIKAQIRIHVREWDRQFDETATYMDYVSDVDSPSSTKLMDASGLHDSDQIWNDYRDWDDFYEDGLDYCEDASYTTQSSCSAAGKTWVANQAIFTNVAATETNTCRELTINPGEGACFDALGVAQPAFTNKADCEANVDKCSDSSFNDKYSCEDNGDTWVDAVWRNNEQSYKNFPGFGI